MSVDLKLLANQVNLVAELREKLAKARSDYARVHSLNGQTGYTIAIGNAFIAVAEMDSHTYQAKMIRGREMIHLGVLKALNGMIDEAADRLRAEELKLAKLAGGAS